MKVYESIDAKRKRQREWLADRRKQWFDANGPCKSCGTWDRLELDHVDPLSKVDHHIFSWSESRRAEELSKCQVLCYWCHKRKTANDMRIVYRRVVNHIHGTNTEYRRGCRCYDCKYAKNVETAKYKNKPIPEYTRQLAA